MAPGFEGVIPRPGDRPSAPQVRENPDADHRETKQNVEMRRTTCPASFSTVKTPDAIGSATTCPVCGASVTLGYASRIPEHDDVRAPLGTRELDDPHRD